MMGEGYTGEQRLRGPHPGYRGVVMVDAMGVHLSDMCEFLMIGLDTEEGGWPTGTWEPVLKAMIVPWHRVDCVEWDEDEYLRHVVNRGDDEVRRADS